MFYEINFLDIVKNDICVKINNMFEELNYQSIRIHDKLSGRIVILPDRNTFSDLLPEYLDTLVPTSVMHLYEALATPEYNEDGIVVLTVFMPHQPETNNDDINSIQHTNHLLKSLMIARINHRLLSDPNISQLKVLSIIEDNEEAVRFQQFNIHASDSLDINDVNNDLLKWQHSSSINFIYRIYNAFYFNTPPVHIEDDTYIVDITQS